MRHKVDQHQDHSWESATIAAFSAWHAGETLSAAAYWQAALLLSAGLRAHDARRAAAYNNAALAQILFGETEGAQRLIESAVAAWGEARDWVKTSDPPLAGRSSCFHLRLASRNGEAFSNIHRTNLTIQCEAGRAISFFNLRALSALRDEPAATDFELEACISAIANTFGPASREIDIMQQQRRTPEPNNGPRAKWLSERWSSRLTQIDNDAEAVTAAAHLTAIFDEATYTPCLRARQ